MCSTTRISENARISPLTISKKKYIIIYVNKRKEENKCLLNIGKKLE